MNENTIRPEVAAFALLMEQKLRENDTQKNSWRLESVNNLMCALLDEYDELDDALITWFSRGERDIEAEGVHYEAADLANFAMFIADVTKHLELSPGITSLRIEEVRR